MPDQRSIILSCMMLLLSVPCYPKADEDTIPGYMTVQLGYEYPNYLKKVYMNEFRDPMEYPDNSQSGFGPVYSRFSVSVHENLHVGLNFGCSWLKTSWEQDYPAHEFEPDNETIHVTEGFKTSQFDVSVLAILYPFNLKRIKPYVGSQFGYYRIRSKWFESHPIGKALSIKNDDLWNLNLNVGCAFQLRNSLILALEAGTVAGYGDSSYLRFSVGLPLFFKRRPKSSP